MNSSIIVPAKLNGKFEMVRNANVEVRHIVDEKRNNVAEVTINGRHQHRFPANSRVSRHLDMMTPQDLGDIMTGGSYFFVEDQLVDWRNGDYINKNGYVHSDAHIGQLMDTIGFGLASDQLRHRGGRGGLRSKRQDENKFVLRSVWSNSEISVPQIGAGGDFTSQLSYEWSPFVKVVNSSFDLIRLICTNGMVGLTSFLNTKVPLMNRMVEHLDIASTQIQNRVDGVIRNRMLAMVDERASVGECLLLQQHVYDRLHSGGEKRDGERDDLLGLLNAVSPTIHLSGVYQPGVFADKNLAAQLPGHLSTFDVYNICTEIRSHTSESRKSSDHALDRMANGLIFDADSREAPVTSNSKNKAAFSDANMAFFGRMN